MRLLIILFLTVLVAATNVGAGIARGQADPVAQTILCIGEKTVMVYVDETGAPTGPPVLCPEGVMALFDVSPEAQIIQPRELTLISSIATADAQTLTPDPFLKGIARGPPSLS